jgi:hypothetical protein
MIGGVQPKLLVSIDENGELHLNPQQAELLGLVENGYNWKLVRERDGLTKQSKEILWLEFNDEGRFKAKHDEPSIGRSLIMSPFNNYFTWQTTVITELIEVRNDYVKFKTENSTYELFKL